MKKATATADARDIAIKKIRLFSLILTFIIIITGLTACGKGNGDDMLSSSPSPTPTETPKFLWSAEFAAVSSTPFTIVPLGGYDGGFFAYGLEKTGEDIPQQAIDKAKKNKEQVVNDGRYDINELRLVFVNNDGSIKTLSDFTALPISENTENWTEFGSVSGISAVICSDEGNIKTLEYVYASGSSKPDDAEYIQNDKNYNEFLNEYYIRTLSTSGVEINKIKISLPENVSYLSDSFIEKGEKYYTITSLNGEGGIGIIDGSGVVTDNIMTDGNVIKLADTGKDSVAVLVSNNNKYFVYVLDTNTKEFTYNYALPDDCCKIWPGNGEYDFFYTSGVNFMGASPDGAKVIFNWLTVNVNTDTISSDVLTVGSDEVYFMTSDGKIWTLKRMDYDESAERKALVLACVNPSYALKEAVAEYNSSHYEVRIDIEDYTLYTQGRTGIAALKEYAYSHLGGKMPDIIATDSISLRSACNDGLLEDLYKYIDADTDMSRTDFFANALKLNEVDGGLYSSVSGFNIDTVIGSKDIVGDSPGWGYEDYYSALSSMGDGVTGFDAFTTSEDILKKCLAVDMNLFVDFENGVCSFDDGRFEELLKFANTFPAYYDYGNASFSDVTSTDIRIRENQQMLLSQKIYGFDDFLWAGYEFEGDVSYIGYPTSEGTGNTICIASGDINLAISSECSDKVSAWEFIRKFFSEEYQLDKDYFPSNINAFEAKLEDAMIQTPVLSKYGEQLYDDETGLPRIWEVGTMYLSDYTPCPYYPITEEKAEMLRTLINTTEKAQNYNEDIFRIVKKGMMVENPVLYIQQQVTAYLGEITHD